jgi:hypothetical protein
MGTRAATDAGRSTVCHLNSRNVLKLTTAVLVGALSLMLLPGDRIGKEVR